MAGWMTCCGTLTTLSGQQRTSHTRVAPLRPAPPEAPELRLKPERRSDFPQLQREQRCRLLAAVFRLQNEVDLLNLAAAIPSFRLDRYGESRQSVHFFKRRFECSLVEWVPALKLLRILSRVNIRVLRA